MDGDRAHQPMTQSVREFPISNLQFPRTELRLVFFLVISTTVLVLTVGWYWPPEKLVFPFTYIQSYKYQWLASRLPAGDIKAKRFRAIAEAARQSKTEYEFQTGPLPAR